MLRAAASGCFYYTFQQFFKLMVVLPGGGKIRVSGGRARGENSFARWLGKGGKFKSPEVWVGGLDVDLQCPRGPSPSPAAFAKSKIGLLLSSSHMEILWGLSFFIVLHLPGHALIIVFKHFPPLPPVVVSF